MRFTFCAFTYNQKDLIVQQLESIKYQIENYGKGVECHFLLADDHSTDGTPDIVSVWLEENPGLFSNTKLLVSETNRGIVANYTVALRNIDTEYFKIIAGDDFYYKNNIFDIYDDCNLVLSPIIRITQENEIVEAKDRIFEKLYRFGDDSERIKHFVLRQIKYGMVIFAPGVFMSSQLIDQGLFEALEPFKWIEDVPEWFYLMGRPGTKVRTETKPLVVYRTDIGVSNNPRSEAYLKDAAYLRSHVQTRLKLIPKYRNPFFYMKVIDRNATSLPALIRKEGRKKVYDLKQRMKQENAEASDYTDMIISRADSFYKHFNER